MASGKKNNNNGSNANNSSSSSSGGSKGWFEGTMEVISGMEVISSLAPRPSTPVSNPNLKKRSSNNNNARGSMSAPSSPARSGASSFFPLINRLPSQDSMDRSTHNDYSSAGRTASQIIRELKQANASLSAKTATMEAEFMNQMNHQNRKAEERHRRLEETLKKSEKLLMALEGRCKTAEQSLKERDEQLTKLREEGAFQRHTISDLKNQLHQLELQQEEAEYGERDAVDKWQVEKQKMGQELEDLRAQVQDSQVLQQEVERLNIKLEDLKLSSSTTYGAGGVLSPGGADDESIHSQLGSSQRSSYTNRSFMKQSLPQTRDILKKTKHRLSVTEAALDILKQERARMMYEHQLEVEEMQQHMEAAEQAHREREDALQQTVQIMEKQQQQIVTTSRTTEMNSSIDGDSAADINDTSSAADNEVNVQLEETNKTIARLKEQVREYEEKVKELLTSLDKIKADAENQEQYRADEAEDLRVLHDAQEEEIERLRKELDDVNRELELRDQELEELKLAMENAAAVKQDAGDESSAEKSSETTTTEEGESTAEVNPKKEEAEAEPEFVATLKHRLKDAEAAIERLETTLDTTRKEHHDRVAHLERVLHETTEGKEDAEEQLAQLSAVLVVDKGARNAAQASRSLADSSEDEDEAPLLPHDGSTAVDLTIMLRNVEQLQENERKAVSRVKELEAVQAELEELRNSRQSETQELEELVARLKESEEKLSSTRDGAMEEYRAEIQKLRGQLKAKDSQRVHKLEGKLKEAQASLSEVEHEKAALVEEYMARIKRLEEDKKNMQDDVRALKDEKADMIETHMKTLQLLEEDKAALETDFKARIKARDDEIAQLKKTVEQATNERDELRKNLDDVELQRHNMEHNHTQSLEQLKKEKEKMQRDFLEQIQTKDAEISDLYNNTSTSSTGEPTFDSDQVAVLKQEIEKLQRELLVEQVEQQQQRQPASDGSTDGSSHRQSGGALEADLRKKLEALQRDKEEESKRLKEKLDDRDTTISALVKSSMGLEQKISQLTSELQTLRKEGPGKHNASKSVAASNHEQGSAELREVLCDYKEVERRLLHELSTTKKQLKFAESEIARLQEVMDDEVSCDSHHYRRQVQERDDAVSALVQQSMSQENEMQKLKQKLQTTFSELEAMRAEKQRSSVQLRAELRRLHQESEIFAGQIIEQDEELEALRAEIHGRDEKIASLNRQLTIARGPHYRPGMMTPDGDSPEVVSLKAQIDELEEANETYRTELRDLRFKLRDHEIIRSELARARFDLKEYERKAQAMAGAQGNLQAAEAARQEIERQFEELQAAKEANSQACDLLAREKDALVGQRDAVIEELRRNIDGCTSQIEALETEIDVLHKELKEKAVALEASEQKVKKLLSQAAEESRSPNGENENSALFEEVDELQQQVKDLENENQKLAEFKKKMTEVEAIQEQSNKMAEAYERKLSLLALDKDATIDSLRKSLMEIKGQAAEDFEAMARDLKKLDLENQTLRREMEEVLEQKNHQIFALEHTLNAQEQLVGNMKSEMDHLQGSMENNVSMRRDEIEDMEKEVLDLATRNAAYEREITSLKMQLEENKLAHMAEVAKLKETVDMLSRQAPPSPVAQQKNPLENFPIHEVKERLEKLRWRNNSIQEENFKLKSRLERAEAEIQTARNEKYRTASLEAKVGALTKQLEALERDYEAARKAAKSSAAPETDVQSTADYQQQETSMAAPHSPSRRLVPRSLPGSRSGTPARGQQPQKSQSGVRPGGSLPGSRQATPQRKRTPLQPRQTAQRQQAPDTPSGRKRSIFGFRRKSDPENGDETTPKRQYLMPPSNPPAPQSDKTLTMNAPRSNKSIQSAM